MASRGSQRSKSPRGSAPPRSCSAQRTNAAKPRTQTARERSAAFRAAERRAEQRRKLLVRGGSVIGVLAIAFAGGGIAAFAVAFLASSAIVNVAQVVIARRQMRFHLRGGGPARRELIRIGVPFAIARLESVRAQEALTRFHIHEVLHPDRIFRSVEEAIRALRRPPA